MNGRQVWSSLQGFLAMVGFWQSFCAVGELWLQVNVLDTTSISWKLSLTKLCTFSRILLKFGYTRKGIN